MLAQEAAYREDLAYIHDAGFGDLAREAAAELCAILSRRGIDHGLVVDFGCGSGRLARQLVESGFDVHGIDVSAAMIALARRTAPRATFTRASFLEVPVPPCIAATAIGESLNYRFDRQNGKPQLRRFFRRLHQALERRGVFVCDIAGPGCVSPGAVRTNLRSGADWAVATTTREYAQHTKLTRHITTFRRVATSCRRDEETHELRLFEPRWIAEELRSSGFRVQKLAGYGKLRLGQGQTGFVAQKLGPRRRPPRS